MSHKGYYRKVLGTLRPADALTQDYLAGIPEGALVKCESTRPRSLPHHRLFFALLHKIYDAAGQDRFPSFESFRAIVTIGAGHFEWVTVGNHRYPIARSIAFHRMDQDEFNKFFDAAVDCICRKLRLVDEPDMRREFEEMLGDTQGAAA